MHETLSSVPSTTQNLCETHDCSPHIQEVNEGRFRVIFGYVRSLKLAWAMWCYIKKYINKRGSYLLSFHCSQSWVRLGFRSGLPLVCSAVAKKSGWSPMRPMISSMPTPIERSRSWSKIGWGLWLYLPGLNTRKTLWLSEVGRGTWVSGRILSTLERPRR